MNVQTHEPHAWIDPDGVHVWFAHDCMTGREVTMLPYPTWHEESGQVRPSINCTLCDTHAFFPVEEAP